MDVEIGHLAGVRPVESVYAMRYSTFAVVVVLLLRCREVHVAVQMVFVTRALLPASAAVRPHTPPRGRAPANWDLFLS